MKKSFKLYAACWAILLALFNVICFVTPDSAAGMNKFGGAFWAGYAFITAAFIGQLVCAYITLKGENLAKTFLNLPLITISYSATVLTVVVGALCMAIPDLPDWVAIIVCACILGFSAISLIKASGAAQAVADVDEKIKAKTAFIKTAAKEAENIFARAQTLQVANALQIKEECKKVCEALKYGDPTSAPALEEIEREIDNGLKQLKQAVIASDGEKVAALSAELLLNVKERNGKCKALK